jgi:acetyl-CoA synthetase
MTEIDALLQENRSFPPPPEFAAKAEIRNPAIYTEAAADPEAFWAAEAGRLEWMEPWTRVLEWTPPHVKWFVGGKLNASANCVDRHALGARRDKAALIWEGEPGDSRTLTYGDMYT